jgi:hypothetical protein
MPKLLLILFTVITITSYGQKITVDIKTDSAQFSENGVSLYPPFKIKLVDPSWIYIAIKKGYVNQGFTFPELVKKVQLDEKGRGTYTIDLEKIKPLPAGYSSKVIEIYKVVDKAGKIIECNFSDPFFTTELTNKMISYGYKNISNTDPFDNKQKEAQLKIVGEITQFSINTIGPRFQISIIVNWLVYDILADKVVFQYSSVGFSDTESRFKTELGYALRNAMVGLMSNTEFQRLASGSGDSR